MVRRGSSERQESELDRIQDLFPHDSLRLHEPDPLARRGLLRSRSAATLKLQRALSGPASSVTGGRHATTRRQASVPSGVPVRTFLLEAPVKLTTGVQSQERHFFLFHDLLLIAKPRSSSGGTQFKLKEKVLVCELWLSETGVEDVAELPQHRDTSFVIGWPTTNHVATFNSSLTKELWRSKLEQLLLEAKEREGLVTTTLPVTYLDTVQRQEYPKLVKITNTQTTSDIIQVLLRQLCLQETERSEYQLWVKTVKDDSPYPLIGHEFPFSIKMNLIRDLLQRSELDLRRLNSLSTDAKCSFILRRHSYDVGVTGSLSEKKSRPGRRPSGIAWPFFRSRSHAVAKVSPEDRHLQPQPTSPRSSSLSGHFFGQHLDSLIKNDQLPVPLQCIFRRLYCKGPRTVGIFRKSGNVRLCRELKEHIEAQDEINWDTLPVVTLASLLKEFLRGLPDCLLQSSLYEEWLQAISRDSQLQRRKHISFVLSRLPDSSRLVLVHLLCLLSRISQDARKNKMSAENLAVCIGPTLLSPTGSPSPCLQSNDVSKKVPKLVTFLIEDWPALFGGEPLQLFSGIDCTHDSGAEDSDSLPEHSETFPSGPRDDSSLDSLEEEETVAPNNCAKVSLTNLSHDSGLTLSDTQLYTPEEDAGLEDSGCVMSSPHRAKSVPYHLERQRESPQRDVKLYNGLPSHLDRLQRGRHKAKESTVDHRREASQILRRSASEESLLEKYMGSSSLGTLSSQHRRPVAHHKGRAPSPPASSFRSSKTGHMDNQAVWFARHSGHMDWNRSQSTSKIDNIDLPSSSCSINEPLAHSCADFHVYENIPTGISSPVYATSFPPCEPPSYDEALTRRNLLRRLQTPPNAAPVTEQMRQEQTTLSAKAKQLYEESLRLYNGDKTHHAIPAQVKEDRLRHLPPVHVTDAQIASRPAHRVVAYQRTWKPRPDIPDDLQGGIHWSVAQLRTLFNNTVSNGRRQLPPYRDPPPFTRSQEESFV